MNKTTLTNNVRILTKKIPHARSVSMGVWVNVGARDESVHESGLSHFIEHMIFKGTGRRNAFQIAKEFDAIGGHTNAFTTMENTCYHAKVMDAQMETMVDILSDIFLNSIFDPVEVDRERPVILQEIGMVEDSPDEYVHVLLGLNYWGDNPLGRSILGDRENILRFDSESIKTFFRQLYQPERIVISAAGNLDHNRLIDMIGPAFESIRSNGHFPKRITPKSCSVVDVHNRDQEQVHICIGTNGLSITDPKRYCYSLLNTILGGNMSSRLFQEIRERRGLAYTVYSFTCSHVDTGMTGVYAGVDPNRTHETIAVILDEMKRIRQIPIDISELNDAIAYTKGNLLLASESVENQMVRLAQNEIHLGRYVPLKEVVENIETVTPDDILDLARRLFQTGQVAVTLLGPAPEVKSLENIIAFE
ncbi:M16 family metallopeptidase [Thermodesulfobacteriota bacterium]